MPRAGTYCCNLRGPSPPAALAGMGWSSRLSGSTVPFWASTMKTAAIFKRGSLGRLCPWRSYISAQLVCPHPPWPFGCHQSPPRAPFLLRAALPYFPLLVVLLASGLFIRAFSLLSLLLCLGRTPRHTFLWITPFFVICKRRASLPVVPNFTVPRSTGVLEFLSNSSKLEDSWGSFYISRLTINSCLNSCHLYSLQETLKKGN